MGQNTKTQDQATARSINLNTMVSPHKKFISIRRTFTKTAGFGIYIGWSKYPCVLIFQILFWSIFLGPHIYENGGTQPRQKGE